MYRIKINFVTKMMLGYSELQFLTGRKYGVTRSTESLNLLLNCKP